jgi:hypothetical protein
MAKLTPEERETVIIFNESTEPATLTTCSKRVIREMTKLWGEGERLRPKSSFFRWEFDKSRLRLPKPIAKARGGRRKGAN